MEEAPSLGTSCTVASYTCFSSKPISCVVDILNRDLLQALKTMENRRMSRTKRSTEAGQTGQIDRVYVSSNQTISLFQSLIASSINHRPHSNTWVQIRDKTSWKGPMATHIDGVLRHARVQAVKPQKATHTLPTGAPEVRQALEPFVLAKKGEEASS